MAGADGAPIRARLAWWLAAAAIAGIALRLAFGLGYWTGQPLTRDEREYLSLSRSLATGRGFTYDATVTDPFGRAPGYPVFLSLVGGGTATPSEVPTPVKVAQALVGGLGVVLVGLVAGRLAGRRAAVAAALVAAVYPPLVWISAYALSEAFFWPLAVAVVWLFDAAWRNADDSSSKNAPPARESTRRDGRVILSMAVAGLATGAAVLTRPSVILFVALAMLWLLWRRRFVAALAFAAAAALVVAPWSIHMSRQHDRLVLVTTEGGVTFWIGNHPLAIGEGDWAANPAIRRDAQALRARYSSLDEEAMEPIYYQEALAWIRSHPIDWLMLEARKLVYLVVPVGPSYTLHSTRYHLASVVSYGCVLALAIAGFMRIRDARRRTPGLWLLAGSAVAACLLFFPQERFRIPILDPTLVIVAGGLAAPGRGRVPS